MFVQATKSARQNGKTYVSYLVRESFRTLGVALHIIPQTLRSAGVSIVWVRGLGFTETF